MTYEEVIAEARRLPVDDQLRLLEDLLHAVRERIGIPEESEDDEAKWRKAFEAERAALLRGVPADSSLHSLLGVGRTRRDVPMTKEEVRDTITDYLMEKYGVERTA